MYYYSDLNFIVFAIFSPCFQFTPIHRFSSNNFRAEREMDGQKLKCEATLEGSGSIAVETDIDINCK